MRKWTNPTGVLHTVDYNKKLEQDFTALGILVALMSFLSGIYLIIPFVALFREIMVIFLGNELCIGLIFSAWFLGLFFGVFISWKFLCKSKNRLYYFFATQIIQAICFPIAVYLIRDMRGFIGLTSGEMIPFFDGLYTTILYITPFSTICGMFFPLACCLLESEPGKAETLYILECVGFFVGGIAYTYHFVKNIPSIPLSVHLAMLVMMVLFIFSFFVFTGREKKVAAFVCFILLVYLFIGVRGKFHYFYEDASIRTRWQGLSKGSVLLQSYDTAYQNISVTEEFGQFRIYGYGKCLFVFPEAYKSAMSAHVFRNQHPNPKKILVVGGGYGGLISELLRYRDISVDYIELEPAVINIALSNTLPHVKRRLRSERVKIRIVDGRHYIKVTKNKYDIVIISPAEPTSIMLNRYFTTNFYKQIKHTLNPGGVVITHIPKSSDFLGEQYNFFASSFFKTFKMVFPHTLATPGENITLFGSIKSGQLSQSPRELSRRFDASNVRSDKFMPSLFEFIFIKGKLKKLRESLEDKEGKIPFNTDLLPVAYSYALLMWDKASGNIFSEFIDKFSKIKRYLLLVPLLLFMLSTIFLQRKKSEYNRNRFLRTNIAYTRFSVSFAAVGMQALLIFVFQNFHGYIYQKIGLLMALFILGTIFGGMMGKRYTSRTPLFPERVYFILVYAMSAVCLGIPSFFKYMVINAPYTINVLLELGYYVLILVCSVFVGATFQVGNFLLMSTYMEVHESVSFCRSVDYLGSFAGSFLVIILLLPLFGVDSAAYVIGCLLLTSAVVGTFWLAMYPRKYKIEAQEQDFYAES